MQARCILCAVPHDVDLGRGLTLWTTAECKLDCIIWLLIYCTFGNAPKNSTCVPIAIVAVLCIFSLKLDSIDNPTIYCRNRCDLIILQYIYSYSVIISYKSLFKFVILLLTAHSPKALAVPMNLYFLCIVRSSAFNIRNKKDIMR